MLLLADRGLDDGGVVCVGNQADSNVDLLYFCVEGSVIFDIEADGSGILNAIGKRFRLLEGSAGYGDFNARISKDFCSRTGAFLRVNDD